MNVNSWQHLPESKIGEGVYQKSFSGEGATLAMNRIAPGVTSTPHSHMHEQIVYVLEGKVNFFVDKEVFFMEPGGLVTIPPYAEHYLETLGEVEAVTMAVFVPRRD